MGEAVGAESGEARSNDLLIRESHHCLFRPLVCLPGHDKTLVGAVL